jgi:high-affinity nickel-transport protein
MSLADTTDSILMLVYGWAFLNPVRKLFYDMTIAAVLAVVAVGIGGIEVLRWWRTTSHGAFSNVVNSGNDNWGVLGCLIIAVFVATWLGPLFIYRARCDNEIEVRIS